jgi:hypothetical protein
MRSIGFVVPVLPGKEQADLDWMNALDGARREEYRAAWSEAGFKRHRLAATDAERDRGHRGLGG